MEVDQEALTDKGNFDRDNDLWFEDGSVVIAAGDVGFRVYKGILSSKSPVFKDLFSLPQPPGQEMIDGCPVVRVQDSPKEMRRFLTIMCDGSSAWVDRSWPNCRAVLTLSHKYQVNSLLLEGIQRLKERFPDDILHWDKQYEDDGIKMGSPQDCISQANVARLLDEPILHYRALYDCCQLSSNQMVNGIVNEDGIRETLCSEDIRACVDARTNLAKENIVLLLGRFSTCPESAHKVENSRTTRCKAARLKLVEKSSLDARLVSYNPLEPDMEIYGTLPYKLCEPCARFCTSTHNTMRQSIINKLGDILGLTSKSSDSADDADIAE